MLKVRNGGNMKFITRNEKETYELGIRLGEILTGGMVLSLNGDLGAGKTHFTKGIAVGLTIEDYITSPSFTILNEYEGRLPLHHFDVYRIDDIDEMYEIGFEEYLFGDGICVVEWGDIVRDMLPKDTIYVSISRLDDNTREIFIKENEKLKALEEMVK